MTSRKSVSMARFRSKSCVYKNNKTKSEHRRVWGQRPGQVDVSLPVFIFAAVRAWNMICTNRASELGKQIEYYMYTMYM